MCSRAELLTKIKASPVMLHSHCWIKLLKARAYHGGIHLRSQQLRILRQEDNKFENHVKNNWKKISNSLPHHTWKSQFRLFLDTTASQQGDLPSTCLLVFIELNSVASRRLWEGCIVTLTKIMKDISTLALCSGH